MAKALRTAAFVVGAAALIVATAGAASAGFAAGFALTAGISVTSAVTIASAAAAVLSLAATAITPKGTVGGNATKFKIDKDAGIPYVMGRTYVGGNVIHRAYYGAKNIFESWVTALSLGPVKGIGPLLIDKVAVGLMAGTAIGGSFAGFMWLDTQFGACPETRALSAPQGAIPGWDGTSKLSGLAADLWTLKFDTKGKVYPNGVPNRGRVLEGVFVYDARLDSTYPGGNGPCRLGQESTYVYNENPACHAVTWAYGRYHNGHLVAGGGLDVTGIDLGPFVEWSNICDANDWKVGGQVYTTADNKWDVLKMIAQAGAGEVMPVGAMLSCSFSAPRVSIGTITTADIMGDIDAPSTASIRQRRNTIIPRVRLEAQGWEVVPIAAVTVAEYVAEDRAPRPKEIEYPLIQDADQAAQIAIYDMLNMRELDGIVLPCKIYALGYRPGDCLTIDIPEANLIRRDVIVRQREIDGPSLGVTLTCRTETPGKHAYALGQTGVPPRTPDLSIPGTDTSAPTAAEWTAQGVTLSANGASIPALVVTGGVTNGNVEAVVFDYRVFAAGNDANASWIGASIDAAGISRKEFGTVTPGTSYELGIRYRIRGVIGDRLILGPVTAGVLSLDTTRAAYRIVSQSVVYPVTSDADSIDIVAFSALIDDGRTIALPAGSIGGLTGGTEYVVIWSMSSSTYSAVASPALDALASSDNILIRYVTTQNADGTYPGSPTAPGGDGGGGGGGRYSNEQML